MANCAHCNKQFTCGCQKASLGNGVIVSTSSNLNRELARQQIQDLRNK